MSGSSLIDQAKAWALCRAYGHAWVAAYTAGAKRSTRLVCSRCGKEAPPWPER
jgi:hypothetical protein